VFQASCLSQEGVRDAQKFTYPQHVSGLDAQTGDPPVIDDSAEGYFERPLVPRTGTVRYGRETKKDSESSIVIDPAVEGRFGRRLVVVVSVSSPARFNISNCS